MIEHRIHHWIRLGQVRCGQARFKNATTVPADVTCENCKKLMKGTVG